MIAAAIGKTCELQVVEKQEFGFYLDAGKLGKVLLPRRQAPQGLSAGDRIEVFLYYDADGDVVASTQKAKAQVGEFAYLKVSAITDFGAFLDWGLDKDVLVPFAEQHKPMAAGHSYLVYVYINKADGRITASSKVDKFVDDAEPQNYKPQQAVDLIIANSTDLGYKAVINQKHWGMLFKEDVFQRLSFGQHVQGFIKQIRPDGKIDLSLHSGPQSRDRNQQTILHYLQNHGGFASVHDKSDPQLIAHLFGMSKASFKKAIGGLYQQRIIDIGKDGIRLQGEQE